MKVSVLSRRLKLLSKILLCFFVFCVLLSCFPDSLITCNGRERGERGTSSHSDDHTGKPLESSHLKLMLTVLVLPANDIQKATTTIDATWGGEVLGHYRMIVTGADLTEDNSAHILHVPQCSDFLSDDPKHLYCILKAVHNFYIHEYKWFLVASQMIYPLVQKMERYLGGLNPNAFQYIGEQVQGQVQGHSQSYDYCSVKSGILLSRRALQTIVDQLEMCMLFAGSAEEVLGRCIAMMVQESCRDLNEDFSQQQDSSSPFNKLVFNFIQDEQEMDDIHSFTQNQEIGFHYKKLRELCNSMIATKNSVCDRVFGRCELCTITEHITGKNSMEKHVPTEDKIDPWEILQGHKIFSSESQLPSQKLSGARGTELVQVRTEAIRALHKESGRVFAFLRMLEVYVRYKSKVGREYIVDMLVKDVTNRRIEKRRVSLVRPLSTKMITIEDSPPEVLDKRINFVVPAHNVVERLKVFLKSYEIACHREYGNCKLHIVMYNQNEIDLIMNEIEAIKKRYPNFKYNIIRGMGPFNRGKARDLGMSVLKENDLAFMCDVDIGVDKSFLDRCRQNAIQGERMYFPIVFKYYNMDFVYPGEPTRPFYAYGINEQHGYWCVYGYGNICTYKSDYTKIGGFDPNFEGWGGEDTEIAEKALHNSIEVFRAPDPGLVHQFHFNNCSDLTGKKEQICLGSRNKGLASKVQLADYVYKVKYGE